MFNKLRLMYEWYRIGKILYYWDPKPWDTISICWKKYAYQKYSMWYIFCYPTRSGEIVKVIDTQEKLYRLNSGESIESVMWPIDENKVVHRNFANACKYGANKKWMKNGKMRRLEDLPNGRCMSSDMPAAAIKMSQESKIAMWY